MFVQYITAFIWGLIVLLAFIGYGRILNVLLLPKKKFDVGMQAAFGLVLSITIGGFLNLAGVISPSLLKIFIVLGVLVFLFFWFKNYRAWTMFARKVSAFTKRNKIFSVIVVVLFMIIVARYGFAVSFFGFNGADDHHGYMAFPAQMLQTGSLSDDPFNQRRVESSLGGQYFLHAIILSNTSFKNLHITDNGLGYLILILLLIGFLREKKVEKFLGLSVVFLMTVVVSPVLNITASYTAAVVVFLILRLAYPILEFKSKSVWRNALLVALPFSALCALKSTYIVVSVALFIGCYFIYFRRLGDYKLFKREFIVAVLAIFVFLLPWMLSMLASSGTLLYPIFGRGYQGTAYDAFEHVIRFDLYSLLRLFFEGFVSLITLLPLMAIAIIARGLIVSEEKKMFWLVFFGSLAGVSVLVLLVSGYSLYYYSFAYLFPSILFVSSISLIGKLRFRKFYNFDGRVVGVVMMVFLFGVFLQKDLSVIDNIKYSLNIGDGNLKIGLMNSDLINENEFKQYSDLQKAVPEGEIIIARLDRNFLFDFKRNAIYINDAPGGSSLPPGIPLKSGGEAMANYFLSHDIKYIAYSYGNEANFSRASVSGMLKPHVNPLLRAISENGLAFQDNTMELSKTRQIIYDDGKNFVLDLSIKK
ncbi:MAG: hypothetical protein ABIJ84_03230 [bacterium]